MAAGEAKALIFVLSFRNEPPKPPKPLSDGQRWGFVGFGGACSRESTKIERRQLHRKDANPLITIESISVLKRLFTVPAPFIGRWK